MECVICKVGETELGKVTVTLERGGTTLRIEETIKQPDYTKVQSDGRIRKWKRIAEEGKFLRVILLSDGESVHNAFFDRSFRGDMQ